MERHLGVLALGLVVCAGCASAPVSTAHLGQSMASVTVARTGGAGASSRASEYLTRAMQELALANSLIEGGDGARVHLLLLRADVDAKLAFALVQAQRSEERAEIARHDAEAAAAVQGGESTD